MARCPSCRYSFRVMEDEDPSDFGCPSCGYGDPANRDDYTCSWCSKEFNEDDRDDYAPYCGQDCASEADRDNEESL
jgi:hypothetical protein